jgi:D-Tyr-tRNAtyr deacylase
LGYNPISEIHVQWKFAQTGKFRAQMDVALVNDGPVTIVLDT